MHATVNRLHYIVNRILEVCKYCATEKSKHKLICKVVEERDLNPGEITCLEIISQKKPGYGGCSAYETKTTNKNGIFSQRQREFKTLKVTVFLNKMETTKKNFRIVLCEKPGEKKFWKEIV